MMYWGAVGALNLSYHKEDMSEIIRLLDYGSCTVEEFNLNYHDRDIS